MNHQMRYFCSVGCCLLLFACSSLGDRNITPVENVSMPPNISSYHQLNQSFENILDEELKNLEGMTTQMLALLAKENILTLNDFAELASFELIDKEEGIFKKLDLEEQLINKMIMQAREKWFVEEK